MVFQGDLPGPPGWAGHPSLLSVCVYVCVHACVCIYGTLYIPASWDLLRYIAGTVLRLSDPLDCAVAPGQKPFLFHFEFPGFSTDQAR